MLKVTCPFVLPLCFPRRLAKAGGLAGLAAELSVLPDSAEGNGWDIRNRGFFHPSALIENPGVVFGVLGVPAGCVVICQPNAILYLGVGLWNTWRKIQLFWQKGVNQECPAECALRCCEKGTR